MKNNLLKILVVFFSIFLHFDGKTQSSLPKNVADSLWNIWRDSAEEDTNRLEAINKYVWDGYLFSQPDSAFYFAQLIYDFVKTKGIKDYMGNALNILGISCYFSGDYSNAVHYHTQNLNISIEIDNKQGIAASLNNIGTIYFNQGDFAKAIDYYTRSLKIQEEIGGQKGIASSLNNIGIIYYNQGDFSKALDCHYKSLNIKKETGDKKGIATSLMNIGNIYTKQGNETIAIDYYIQSLTIREEIGEKKGIANSLNNIGTIYASQGYYTKAINYHSRSLKIKEETGNKVGIAYSLNNIGDVYRNQGDSAYRVGNESLSKEKYNKSIDHSYRSLIIAQEIGALEEIKNAARSLLKTYTLIGEITSAKNHLALLYLLTETSIRKNYFTLSENEKQTYFATMETDYGLYYDFTLKYQDKFDNLTDTSYNIALKNKGLTLKSSTAMRTAIQNSGDTTLIKGYEKWFSLKRKISNSNETDSTYKGLVNQANEMERELVKNSSVFSDFDKVLNLKWQDVQASLKNNEAAIEFVHFESEIGTANPIIYAALIVKKDSKHPEMIQLCTETDLKGILGVFQGNNLTFVNGVYGTKAKAEKALYEKIWQPLEKYLEGIKNIYYSPTGLLHKVSFAAISKENNVFLCDNYQLYQQSSTGKVTLSKNVNFDIKDEFLLIGGVQYNNKNTEKEVWNYLPGTKSETENIQSILKKKKYRVNIYTENDASEENFKKKVSESNILHIATHGFFYPDPEKVKEELKKEVDESEKDIKFRGSSIYANWSFVNNKNPLMRSGLVLANANDVWERDPLAEGEDGILTAQEVSNLDLRNTKLVVLSACETGLGDIKGSEGVYGLQRAFKMAGVEYIIMSLWQVPDKETSEFMTYFYTQLIKVKDIRQAFTNTQKYMRKKYDPYYWAAFVLIE